MAYLEARHLDRLFDTGKEMNEWPTWLVKPHIGISMIVIVHRVKMFE